MDLSEASVAAGVSGRVLVGGSILITLASLGAEPDESLARANFSGFTDHQLQEVPQKASRAKQAAKMDVFISDLDIIHTILYANWALFETVGFIITSLLKILQCLPGLGIELGGTDDFDQYVLVSGAA